MKYVLSVFSFLLLFIFHSNAQTTTDSFTTPGTGSFTVPAGVSQITVEVWGAGGGGSSANTAAGGGGGGYARSVLAVSPGDAFSYTVGAGGAAGIDGGDSSFDSTIIGGGGGSGTGSTGGVGGVGSGGNDVNFNGGAGGNSGDGSNGDRGGGGGGGSATSTANGSNGANNSGNSGGSGGFGEGNGGTGADSNNNDGSNGLAPGGGGGGQSGPGGGSVSGSGADGQILITYTITGATCTNLSSVSSNVNDTSTNYIETPEQLNLYTDGTDNYSFEVSTDNDLLLEAFQVDNSLNFAIDRLADRIVLRRAGNANQGPNGEERHILLFEQDGSYGGNNKNFNAVFFPTMEEALVGTGINRGADNVLDNTSSPNSNNIERLDYIFEDGIVVPSDPNTAGFPVFERNGNDAFNLGVISDLDSNADPTEYNTIISYTSADWIDTGIDITSSVLSGFPNDGGDLIESATVSSQNISVIFVSFADMGLSAGDIIYGYSLAGADSTTDCSEFLDFSNSTFFPQNTGSSDGGIDLLSGGSFSKVAFIHTNTGWYQGDDPNTVTPTCDDTLIVSGGTADINSDMTFNSITATGGSLDLNTNTVSLCDNINTETDFEIMSGTINMNGSVKQFIRGNGSLDLDELTVDNTNNVESTTDLSVKGVLSVDNGDFITNDATTFPCSFEEPTTGDFENARAGQIGPIGTSSSIIGEVTVEQCYPGRRAFRFVSSSVTTTNSIQDNWQENATAYNDFPTNDVQDDGIEFGYGTHITGLGEVSGSGHSTTNPSPSDQVQGLDWQPSGNASMFEFDNATQTTNAVLVTETGNTPETAVLDAGKPYIVMIRGSREVNLESNASSTYNTKLRSKGEIVKGGTSTSTTYSGVDAGDFIFIGNPFHAIVDMTKVLYGDGDHTTTGDNNPAIGRHMYAFDPTLGGATDVNPNSSSLGGRGAYATIDMQNPATMGTEMNQYLQAYQGVFLVAAQDNPTITFSEADKAVDQAQLDVFSSPSDRIAITLYDQFSYTNNSTADDTTVILFDQNGNNAVNNNDALKFTNPDENLGRLEGNSVLSIETRAMPQADEVLQLHTQQYRTTDYIFVVEINGLNNNSIYLYDNYTNTEKLLNNNASTAIHFSVDQSNPGSMASDRFEILFHSTTLGTNDFDLAGIAIYPNPASNILNINFGENTSRFDTVELFDISGRLVAQQAISNQLEDTHLDIKTFSSGVYILKVSSKTEQISTKIIIE